MKLYFGKETNKQFIKEVADEKEAMIEMRYYLKEIGWGEPYYWRMWFSQDQSYSIYDFGSWSTFFFLYS
jgi:hypothetical protein